MTKRAPSEQNRSDNAGPSKTSVSVRRKTSANIGPDLAVSFVLGSQQILPVESEAQERGPPFPFQYRSFKIKWPERKSGEPLSSPTEAPSSLQGQGLSFASVACAARAANDTLSNSFLVGGQSSSTSSQGGNLQLLVDSPNALAPCPCKCPENAADRIHVSNSAESPRLLRDTWQLFSLCSASGSPQSDIASDSSCPMSESSDDASIQDCSGMVIVPSEDSLTLTTPISDGSSHSLADKDHGSCQLSNAVAGGGSAGEDRVLVACSKDRRWIFSSICDGFNGRDAADFLSANLFSTFSRKINFGAPSALPRHEACGELSAAAVTSALTQALEETEQEYFQRVEENIGDRADLAMAGSCMVSVFVADGHLYSINLGDSRAVVGMKTNSATAPCVPSSGGVKSCHVAASSTAREADGGFSEAPGMPVGGSLKCADWNPEQRSDCRLPSADCHTCQETSPLAAGELPSLERLCCAWGEEHGCSTRAIELTQEHSATSTTERARIVSEHPNDKSAVSGSRVKGKLRVTRAFGAGYLKQARLNDALPGILKVRDLQSPPYISSTPHVNVHRLTDEDQFVVVASDGLFDFFTSEEVVILVAQRLVASPHEDPAKFLIGQLMERAAERAAKMVFASWKIDLLACNLDRLLEEPTEHSRSFRIELGNGRTI